MSSQLIQVFPFLAKLNVRAADLCVIIHEASTAKKEHNMAAIVKSPNDPRDYRYKSASSHSFVPLFSFISRSNLLFKISRMVKFTSSGLLQRKYRRINSTFQNDHLLAGFRSYVFFR